MVEVLSVPFDLCGPHHGSRLGGMAVQLAGLVPSLARIGVQTLVDDVVPMNGHLPGTREECDAEALQVYTRTRDRVAASIASGRLPLVVGGDHSLAIGSISGAVKAVGEELAVLWIDAHMDANTPDTTPSGNLHGVPLAALSRLEPEAEFVPDSRRPWLQSVYDLWPQLLSIVPEQGVSRDRLYWLGLRDVDRGEVRNLQRLSGSQAVTMQDIDNKGLFVVIEEFQKWLWASGARKLWISFDVDVLDPIYAPGTGTAVRGGLTYREGHLLAEALCRMVNQEDSPCQLVGLDVVEVNPLRDRDNSTAQVAVEWVCSLFGKTIMHGAEL